MALDAATSPFHAGEIAIQRRYGVAERMDAFARKVVRDHLTEQHRGFFARLPTIALGARDAEGRPWATLLAGEPGFARAIDARTLRVDALPAPGDPLAGAFQPDAPIGGLGIQFETRRRNRFAARVAARDDAGLTLRIDQSFGNCPQYIVSRAPAGIVARHPGPPERLAGLDDAARALIGAADTFLIATAAPESGDHRHGADVSHRGGRPGFVRVEGETLTIPDFPGNNHFNTLGNIALDPRAGLTFVDWATGGMLFLTGRAEVDFDGAEVVAFAGAERLWRFRVEGAVRLEGALPIRWRAGEASPNSLATGDWTAAEATLAAARRRDDWRPFRVARIVAESDTVRSLHLEPADGAGVVAHRPGQHLPVRLALPGGGTVVRTYTISDAFRGTGYRLSVKREEGGRASGALHALAEGAVIEAQAPRGSFVLEEGGTRPILMLSAGIGITPMMAMAETLLAHEGRNRHGAAVIFLHAARSGRKMAFGARLRAMAARHPRFRLHVALSRPETGDVLGETHDGEGRIDRAALQALLPLDDYDVYLCGPEGFMRETYASLRGLGVADRRIRMEAFGPSSVERVPDEGVPVRGAGPLPESAPVAFARSGREAVWTPEAGSLLELAEAAGVAAPFSCRSGSCGSCAVGLRSGRIAYTAEPSAPHDEATALLCQARPTGPVTLDL